MQNKETIIKEIICAMSENLSIDELRKLDNVLRVKLHGMKIEEECTELSTYSDDNDYILRVFVANKKLENASNKSIKQYVDTTRNMLVAIDKNYKDVNTDDVKYYLAMYQAKRNVSTNTIANMKRFISAFFSWAENEGFITKNPVRAIRNIKQVRKEKQFLNNDEVEKMRDNCISLREKAMFEFLLSTGLRVSELAALNINDIDFSADRIRIYGFKTRTYRTGYLSAKAKLHLQKYLSSRNDNNQALFVASKGEHLRLGNSSIEKELQSIAERAGIEKHVTVHLFRKTFATKLCAAGTPIEIIKELLGHADISVTEKNYITINQDDVKAAHRRSAA